MKHWMFLVTQHFGEWTPVAVLGSLAEAMQLSDAWRPPDNDGFMRSQDVFTEDLFIQPVRCGERWDGPDYVRDLGGMVGEEVAMVCAVMRNADEKATLKA